MKTRFMASVLAVVMVLTMLTSLTFAAGTEPVYVAKIGETKYETLAAAIANASAGNTITLLDDVTEDVTVNKSLTIDGDGKNYTGNISVSGTSTKATVKNVNFVNGDGYAITTNRINTITVEDCTVKNYGYISCLNALNIGNVSHHHIHADTSQYRA